LRGRKIESDWSLTEVGGWASDDSTTAFGSAVGRMRIRLGIIIAPDSIVIVKPGPGSRENDSPKKEGWR